MIVAIAAAAVPLCTAASASAALDHTFTAKVRPTKAGTKAKPRNATLSAKVTVLRTAPDSQNPTVDKIQLSFARGLTFNTRLFKKCSVARLSAQGVRGCPSGSRIGQGTAEATVGSGDAPLLFDTTFFNAARTAAERRGGRAPYDLAIHLQRVVIQNGQRKHAEGVFSPPTGKFKSASGKYSHALTVSIPGDVQLTAAGYGKLVSLSFTLDKKYRGQSFVRSVGCNRRWNFSSTIHYVKNPFPPSVSSTTTATSGACTK